MKSVAAVFCCFAISALAPSPAHADELPLVAGVELQPLKSQAERVASALEFVGQPLSDKQRDGLQNALAQTDEEQAVRAIQEALDPLCLVGVNINPESRVKAVRGEAPAELNQHGWTVFLVKVHNEAGVTAKLGASSPNAAPLYVRSRGSALPEVSVKPSDVPSRWLELQTFDSRPLTPALSGLELEYRIVQLYSRDAGKREATLAFDVGQGTQDLGFRNEVAVL